MELAMIDDTIVPLEEAKISAHDRGLYFGDGVYEVLIFCRGRLFALDRHMDRLENSLRLMDMLDNVDLHLIRRRLNQAVTQAQIPHALLYFHITRGRALRSHDYDNDLQPSFLLTVRKFTPRPEAATAITHPDERWKRCCIKSLNLLPNILAKHAATKAGAYEAILVEENGFITEGTSTSVLKIKDNVLQTAPLTANILPGITRALLLQWAPELDLTIRQESFTVPQALAADELMLAVTTAGIISVTQLDGNTIADGKPRPYTKQLRQMLNEAISKRRMGS